VIPCEVVNVCAKALILYMSLEPGGLKKGIDKIPCIGSRGDFGAEGSKAQRQVEKIDAILSNVLLAPARHDYERREFSYDLIGAY
jgi:hypothetical protein